MQDPSITDWLMVGITGIYVIATIVLCVYNAKSANSARKQTEEMQRQFKEANRPIIEVELIYEKRCFYGLRFTNTGIRNASNVRIVIDKGFIDSIAEENFKRLLMEQEGKSCVIGAGNHYDLFFGTNDYRKNQNKVPAKGIIKYCNGSNQYESSFDIDVTNYMTHFSIQTDMDDLLKRLDEQNKVLKNILSSVEKRTPSKDLED